MLKAILVRPRFDSATEHTYAFAKDILEMCQKAGIEVIELAEEDAVRKLVEKSLTAGDMDIYIHYDHGDEGALIGQDEKACIDSKNCKLLANKDVYTLACLSGKSLGVDIWNQGGRFWGYIEVVSFTTDALEEFKRAFNCGFEFLFINGEEHNAALAQAKAEFDSLAVELVGKGKTIAAIFMRMNGDNMVCYNANSKPEEKEGCLLAILKSPIRLWGLGLELIRGR